MRFLKENLSSIFISLALAVLVWVAAVKEQNPPREGDYDQSITIEVVPPADEFIVTNTLPETVRLRLLAPEKSWENLTPSKFKASLDLSELDEGLNDASIDVKISDPQIQIVGQTPSEIPVNLETLQTITKAVQLEVLDSPPLGYINRTPTASSPVVEITGPASLISQVDEAAAEVFIRNSKETLNTLRDVLVRNKTGQIIRGVEVEPEKVLVNLPIEQRFGYKDVSVRVRVQGQVAPGYRVSNISVDPPTLTVVGNPAGLSEIGGLVETTPINLDGATEHIVRIVPLNLPDGVTTVVSETSTDGPGGVKVTVEVTPIEDGMTLNRPVTQQGIDPGYWWEAAPGRVDVFLSGPLPQLETLKASDVEVIIDLFGLEPGVYQLQPTIFKPDELRVDTVLPDTVEVTIGRTVQRPVTQQGLGPDYIWAALPDRVDLRLSGLPERLQTLNMSDVRVFADLTGVGPGQHRVKPIVSLPSRVELESISPETIDVTIQLRATPTITPTPTITATQRITATAIATNTVTVTATSTATLTPSSRRTATPQTQKDN